MRKTVEDAFKEVLKLVLFTHRTENYHVLLTPNLKEVVGYVGTGCFDSEVDEERETVESVWYSAAKKGYGPLMYDIAMAESTTKRGKWLCCKDLTSTTQAKNIWNFYYHNRVGVDVQKKDLVSRRQEHLGEFIGIGSCYKELFLPDSSVLMVENISQPQTDVDLNKIRRMADKFFSERFHGAN